MKMSQAEQAVFGPLLLGRSSKEIAVAIGRSYRTVEKTIDNIRLRSGAASRMQLVTDFYRAVIAKLKGESA